MTYDAVLFDFDGTIVEVPHRTQLREAVSRTCRSIGFDTGVSEAANALRKGDTETLVERCRTAGVDVDSFRASAVGAVVGTQVQTVEAGLRSIYRDVTAIRSLDRPVGIVSDNHPCALNFLLDRFDIAEQFAVVRGCRFTRDGFDRRKPSPANLTEAMNELDVDDALYVGDRPVDVAAANNADIDSALVERDESPTDGPSPTYRLSSLEELPTVV